MSNTIIVPIKLTQNDIKIIVEEINNCDSSFLSVFLENILKEADIVANKLQTTAEEIKSVNPFSLQGAKK